MNIHDVTVNVAHEGYFPVRIATDRGGVECRYYPASAYAAGAYPASAYAAGALAAGRPARRGVLYAGGVGGGWDTPARGLYPRLCRDLQAVGLSSLRVRYRNPRVLREATLDVLAGLSFMDGEKIEVMALVGHSFGGAVVIEAAAASTTVHTVVTLATQSHGTGRVAELGPRCSILLLHGTRDRALPASCSRHVHDRAAEPRRLSLYEGAGHGLDEAAEAVYDEVRAWLVERLSEAVANPNA